MHVRGKRHPFLASSHRMIILPCSHSAPQLSLAEAASHKHPGHEISSMRLNSHSEQSVLCHLTACRQSQRPSGLLFPSPGTRHTGPPPVDDAEGNPRMKLHRPSTCSLHAHGSVTWACPSQVSVPLTRLKMSLQGKTHFSSALETL